MGRVTVALSVCTLFFVSSPLPAQKEPAAKSGVGAEPRALADPEQRRLDVWIAAMQPDEADSNPGDEQTRLAIREADEAQAKLVRFAAGRPEAMAYVRSKLLPLPTDPQRQDVRRRFVGVLVHDADPRATRTVIGVLVEEPDLIADGDLLVLAERNLEAAVMAVKRIAGAAEVSRRQIRPAVYLGLRKDPTGKKALEWAVANDKLAENNPDYWVAACAALRVLGEKSIWKECVDRQERALSSLPEKRRLIQAAHSVLRLEYYAAVLKGEKPPSVAGRDLSHSAYIESRATEISTMDEARRRFEALRAL